ncbi:hypothetical protein IJ818_06595 [bacterium]|nr:hypothetical protein [bacterium]
MKRILYLTTLILFLTLPAYAYDSVENNYEITYSQKRGWAFSSTDKEKTVLIKKQAEGSGGYSEYYYEDGTLAVTLNSDYEFIFENNLICVVNSNFKYYKLIKTSDGFKISALTIPELKEIFPNTDIIKISEFVDNQIIIKKAPFKDKNILLLNDTNKYFYKYSLTPNYIQDENIKGLLHINNYGEFEFSHYEDENEKLKITVRMY